MTVASNSQKKYTKYGTNSDVWEFAKLLEKHKKTVHMRLEVLRYE